MILHVRAAINARGDDGVERGPDGSPVAFRIWHAGENVTDHGTHTLSMKSIEKLLAQQAARGNLYSIDVDHMSLNKESPPESRKAVGWFEIAARESIDGPELWAVNVAWTEAVRGGLTQDPPEWRYFSPAYDVTKKGGEIVSLANLALTNNPATWSVTSLAHRSIAATTEGNAMKMTYKEMKDSLAAMAGDDDDKKATAEQCIAAAFPDGDPDEKKKDDDGEKKEEKKSSEDEPEKKENEDDPEKKESEDDPEKKAASLEREGKLLATLGQQDRRIRELESKGEATERAEIMATRQDLTASQKDYLSKQPLARVRELLDKVIIPTTKVAATTAPLRGAGQTDRAASKLPADESAKLRRRMGLEAAEVEISHEESTMTFPAMTPEQAKKAHEAATKRAAGGSR